MGRDHLAGEGDIGKVLAIGMKIWVRQVGRT